MKTGDYYAVTELKSIVGQIVAEAYCGYVGNQKQGKKSIAEQNSGNEPTDIGAFVCREKLNEAVGNQWNQHQRCDPHRWEAEKRPNRRKENSDQFSGTSGADGKLSAMIVKGTIIPTVAAKNDGKPLIQPEDHLLHHAESGSGNGANDVEHSGHNHGDQRTDTGSLGGLRLCILPNQEQDQTDNGNAAAQNPPAKTAVVNGSRSSRILRSAAAGAECCAVIDLCAAVFTKSHNRILQFSLFNLVNAEISLYCLDSSTV